MEKTVAQIAEFIGAKIEGDPGLRISGIGSLEEAKGGELSVLSNTKNLPELITSRASAFIVPEDASVIGKTLLKVKDPSLGLAQALRFLYPNFIPHPTGIHPTAILGEGTHVGEGVAIGPYSVVGDSCRIEDGTIIYGGVHIGAETVIGSNGIIYPNVTIRERTQIGNRVILHPGVVIGADGFGFTQSEGKPYKIPHVGRVKIEDDVEIGANTCIDRATLGTTVIGRGTKIDNLVQLGHNVHIGESCILAGQVGISGSVEVGNGVMMGGQVGVKDHVKIVDGVRVGGQGGVAGNLNKPGDYLGSPAIPLEAKLEELFYETKLSEIFKDVAQIKKQLKSP